MDARRESNIPGAETRSSFYPYKSHSGFVFQMRFTKPRIHHLHSKPSHLTLPHRSKASLRNAPGKGSWELAFLEVSSGNLLRCLLSNHEENAGAMPRLAWRAHCLLVLGCHGQPGLLSCSAPAVTPSESSSPALWMQSLIFDL